MKRFQGVKGIILIVILAILIVSYYIHLSNRTALLNEEDDVKSTAVQKVMSRNLESNYPQTPKEVIKYYSELTKCFYNETYSDEELEGLGVQAQGLYDDELIANKSQQQYMTDLKSEIMTFRNNKYTISSYTTSSSIDIENMKFKQDGYEWTKVYCYYTIKQGSQYKKTTEIFLLRKDDAGHWKIYGWDLEENIDGESEAAEDDSEQVQ